MRRDRELILYNLKTYWFKVEAARESGSAMVEQLVTNKEFNIGFLGISVVAIIWVFWPTFVVQNLLCQGVGGVGEGGGGVTAVSAALTPVEFFQPLRVYN